MNNTYDFDALKTELTEDEGRKKFAYLDTRGNITGAIGRNLSSVGFYDDEIDFLFSNSVDVCEQDLDRNVSWWRTLPQNAQRVMLNLCFNLGWEGLSEFKHFLAAMQAQDYTTARSELKNSLWWNEVGERGPRMLERLPA